MQCCTRIIKCCTRYCEARTLTSHTETFSNSQWIPSNLFTSGLTRRSEHLPNQQHLRPVINTYLDMFSSPIENYDTTRPDSTRVPPLHSPFTETLSRSVTLLERRSNSTLCGQRCPCTGALLFGTHLLPGSRSSTYTLKVPPASPCAVRCIHTYDRWKDEFVNSAINNYTNKRFSHDLPSNEASVNKDGNKSTEISDPVCPGENSETLDTFNGDVNASIDGSVIGSVGAAVLEWSAVLECEGVSEPSLSVQHIAAHVLGIDRVC